MHNLRSSESETVRNPNSDSRRRFLRAMSLVGAGLLINQPAFAENHESNLPYVQFGLYEDALVLTPDHPNFKTKYEAYINYLRSEMSKVKFPNYATKVATAVELTENRYPHNRYDNDGYWLTPGAKFELINQIESGLAACAEMSFLMQYGFKRLGIRSKINFFKFWEKGKNSPTCHLNLELNYAGGRYVAEMTQGKIYPWNDFVANFIEKNFDLQPDSNVEYDQVITGLES